MQSLPFAKFKVAVTATIGAAAGFALLQILPVAGANPYFLFAPPLLLAVVLIGLINRDLLLALLLVFRVLLDPWLEGTKLNIAGEMMGLGAVINLGVIGFGAVLTLSNPRVLFNNSVSRSWIVFLLICLAAAVYSPVPGKALRALFANSSYLAMLIIPFFFVKTPQDKRLWFKVLLASSVLPVLVGNFELIAGGKYYNSVGSRIQSTFSHPNIFGFYLVLQIALLFYLLKSKIEPLSNLSRFFSTAYFLNLVILLGATKTRNAWLACWLFFLVYGIIKERKYLFFSLALPPLLAIHPAVRDRIMDLFHGTGSNIENNLNSFAWRVELWKRSLAYTSDHWLFGNGLASFKPLSLNYFPAHSAGGTPAHNTYVEVFFEMGLAGLIAYCSIYFTLLKSLWSRARDMMSSSSTEFAIFGAYVISYIFSCAGDNMQDYLSFNWYFWFMMGIAVRPVVSIYGNIRHHSRV